MQLLKCTATPPGGAAQWNACNARAHQLGGRGVLPRRRWLPKERYYCNEVPHCLGVSGRCNSCNAPPHCLGAVGRGTPVTQCLTAWGQWAVQLVQLNATPPGGSGQWNCFNAPAYQLGGQGVLSRSRSLPKERYSCNALPHYVRAVGGATLAIRCLTAGGQWAVQLMQCTVSLPGDGGQWNSCNVRAQLLGGQGVLPRRRSLA